MSGRLADVRDLVLGWAADAILENTGRSELAVIDEALGVLIREAPGEWRRLADVRAAVLRLAVSSARAGFVAGLGRNEP